MDDYGKSIVTREKQYVFSDWSQREAINKQVGKNPAPIIPSIPAFVLGMLNLVHIRFKGGCNVGTEVTYSFSRREAEDGHPQKRRRVG